ncbi:MAG: hypothetical protein KZQ70_13135 [gamma proteobacterium symbiont of Lucinoma myriamae]|nr:hypothetical protein [gamma proteobacterium symbiont of Lucinoma myriamae]
MEEIIYDKNATSRFKIIKRQDLELKWIKSLQTPFPLGLNDNIFHQGNISKLPDFDALSLLEIRKRKSRSHGTRVNGNVKRKSRVNMTVSELNKILKQSGRHSMLSVLTSLSISSLRKIDTEVDKFYDSRHPFYDAVLLIRCYTQHALRPYIDSEINHVRHFVKINYINKGIEFIDLPSIFRDKSVVSSIPAYFKNTESPIICYKYNKPIRNVIFNFNKIVSDLDINVNTPDS